MAHVLHRLLEQAAERLPGGEAVRCRGIGLTYAELDAASTGLACTLREAGVERGDRVAISTPKCVEAIVAVYGVLKAGAVCVPLDPHAPTIRRSLVANDCAIAAQITTPARATALISELHRPLRTTILVDDPQADASAPDEEHPDSAVAYVDATTNRSSLGPRDVIDQDLAYILYTSGSTGVPKGVMLTHRNALTFVQWCADTIGIRSDDRLSNHAPLHFDLSMFDLFLASFGGACVLPVPDEEAFFGVSLARFVAEERITVWYSVPSALTLLTKAVDDVDALARLRAVVFAGEVFPTKHLRDLRRLVPGAELWNLYGPTETNVCTAYRVTELPDDDRTIPIGRACENTEVFALKDDGSPAGVGEEGELYVRGSTVMKGYWGRPDDTARVLVPHPLDPTSGDRVYRTGDLVRLRTDGDYDFLGRRDHQIKSRGYRIELGDVESVLNGHPDVAEAVAIAVPHEEWGTAIAAFVVARDGVSMTELDIRRHVASRLPQYMAPASIRFVDRFPRTSTGKVDRRRLAEGIVAGGGTRGIVDSSDEPRMAPESGLG
jgi:amino acid adenylation domain-containing protein